MKNLKSRLLALLLAVALVLSGSASVWAEVLTDESAADVVVTETEAMTESNDVVENPDEELETGTNDVVENPDEEIMADTNQTYTKKWVKFLAKGVVNVAEAFVAYIDQIEESTLEGDVYVNQDTTCGPIIVGAAGLNLIIKDGVTLTIDARDCTGSAGIRCNQLSGPLTITAGVDDDGSEETKPQGTGTIVVYGADRCAAIGGISFSDAGKGCDITIESCIIEAHGGDKGAGIGGGCNYNGENITINGGEVYAYGGKYAAGIGGGAHSAGGTFNGITINGGKVYAYGGEGAAGIGTGEAGTINGVYINENIAGVETYVEAHGGDGGGAGIGTGDKYGASVSAHDIYITGGTVKAYGGSAGGSDGGAGIGGGNGVPAYNITISGGEVTAESKNQAAAIGGGAGKDGYDISISGGTVVADADGSSNLFDGAGIGGGNGGDAYHISISGGSVTAKSRRGAGIGGGTDGKLKDDEYGVNISGGYVTATSGGNGAGIGGGADGAQEGSITISGSTTNVTACSKGGGAGIGSGREKNAGDITINDGFVTAYSGGSAEHVGSGAGIGSGAEGKVKGTIRINGGNVTATGGGDKSKSACDKGNETGCAIGCGACKKDPYENGFINAVYISTSLKAGCYHYDEDGSYNYHSMGPCGDNWVKVNSNYENFSLWRDVEITNNVERKIEITDTQTGAMTYGTTGISRYKLTASYISGADWKIQWYDESDTALEAGPAEFAVSSDMTTVFLTYDGKADAGTYKFTLSCDGITSEKATYVVGKRDAAITSGSATKIYDGTPLTCETYEVSGFVDGEGVKVTCTGSQTETGVSDNSFSYQASGKTNLDNYNLTETCGKLLVVNQLFVITGENYTGVYDGQSHSFEDVKVIGKNGIDYTSKATITYSTSTDYNPDTQQGNWTLWTGAGNPSIKDAGKLYVKAQASATIGGQTTTLDSSVYTLEVTPKPIVLTSGSKEWEYDGKEHKYDDVSYDALAGGESFYPEPYAIGTITKVGAVINVINTDDLFGGTAKKENYTIIKEEGLLTVTPKTSQITITTPSNSKTYDGDTIDAKPGEVKSNFDAVKASGDTISITLDRTGEDAVKDAGTYDNGIASYQVTNGAGEDVTACYSFAEPVIGTLTIEKRQVTLTSGSDLKVYQSEGDKAYNDTVTASGDGLLDGEGLSYSGFRPVTAIDYTPTANTFTYTKADDSNFDEKNYDITVETGWLMLVAEMSIIGEDQTFVYDGNKHEAPVKLVDNGQGAAVTVTYATSTDNQTWSEYSANVPSLTDAGILYVKAKAIKGVQEKDASYTLEVQKRSVLITSDSAAKTYDGKALTCEGYTVSGSGFADGQGINKMTYTGTQTDAGTSQNTFTYELNANTNPENYTIHEDYGTLTVTKNAAPVEIVTGSGEWVYNGTAMSCTDCFANWNGKKINNGDKLCGNDVLQIIPKGAITNVGSTTNTCDYKVVRDGVDVTDNYTFAEPEYGTLTITARSIVINTASDEKVYDGTALTKKEYTLTGDGFIDGEGFAAVNIAGTRTNAGTADNILDETTPYTLQEGTKAENYNITVETGTLTVNKRKVTVTSGSAVSTWSQCPSDGLTNNSICTVSGDGFINGELTEGYPKGAGKLAKPASEPALSTPETAENTIDYGWTGNGNPANYEITENLGTLMVLNNSATSAVATGYVGVYDGQSHKGTFSTSIQDPDEIKYSTDGELSWSTTEPTFTDAGKYTVAIRVEKDSNVAQCSYEVTIKKRSLVLTAGSAEKVYDGTALTCEDYIIGGDGFANATEAEDAGVKTEAEESIIDAGFTNNWISELKDNFSFKTANYDISYNKGTLTVTKRPVQLMSVGFAREYAEVPESIIITKGEYAGTYSTAPVTYDGKEHGCEAVIEIGKGQVQGIAEIPGTGFVEGQGATYSDFTTIKDAGLYENKFEYKLNSNTDSGNYDIECIYGLMRILPCDVTIASGSDSKKYDGSPLTKDGVTVTTSLGGNTMPENEVLECEVTGSQTEVGTSANTFDWTITNYKEINYNVTKVEGTLEVYTSDQLRIVVPEDKTYEYDGQPHGEAANAYIGSDPCSETIWYSTDGGTTWSDEGAPQLTTLGTLTVKAYVEKNGYYKAEGSYTITVEESDKLNIKAPEEQEWVYDGQAHGDAAAAYIGTDPAGDATVTYSVDGGTTWNATVPQITDAGTLTVMAKATQYGYKDAEVTYTLTITQAEGLTVEAPETLTFKYDGTAHGDAAVAYLNEEVFDNAKIVYSTDNGETWTKEVPAITDAGQLEVLVKTTNGNYKTAACEYTLEVLPREITITSASAEKVYDGQPLVKAEYTLTGDGFAKYKVQSEAVLQAAEEPEEKEIEEGIEVKVTGSRTEVGSSKNTITYTFNEDTKAENYNITLVEGTLTVTAASPGTGTNVNSMIPAVLALIACAGALVVVMKKRNNA